MVPRSASINPPPILDPVGDSSVTTDVTDEVDAVVDKGPPLDPALVGIQAASFGSPPGNETSIFTSIMNEIITLPVSTITHIPRNVRPLLAQVFCKELQHACKDDIWGFVRLSLLPKAVLRPPPRGGRKKRYVVAKLIIERLHRWLDGDLEAFWLEARNEVPHKTPSTLIVDVADSNAKRATRLAQEGWYSDAMRALVANGRTSADNVEALNDIIAHHPCHSLPTQSDNHTISPSITVDSCGVTFALKRFPRRSSPGGSKLRAEHLLDITSGSTSPYAPSCLSELTRFINMLLAGKIDARIAPWLVGAPLIALQKKDGGHRPIAVGEVFRRLASRLCCTAVHSFLPDTFLPYNQVGVGIRGGLEAAIHSVNKCLQ